MTTLAEIFRKYGTDKYDHGYFSVYEKLPPPARMLEVGVFKGASLRAWREFWPQADIVGADTFERGTPDRYEITEAFPPNTNPWVVQADSRTDDFARFYRDHDAGPDLIIDDASHKPRDQAATFLNLFPLLASGGRYFVEDCWDLDVMTWTERQHPWLLSHSDDFNAQAWAEFMDIVVPWGEIRHDFRAQSGKPDSVLIEVRKPA